MAGKDNLVPFQKGDPKINRKGRPVVNDIKRYVKERLAESAREPNPGEDPEKVPSRLEAITNKLLIMAHQGNLKALEILMKYGYGNPTQMVEVVGKDGAPVNSVPMLAWVGAPMPVATLNGHETPQEQEEKAQGSTDEPKADA